MIVLIFFVIFDAFEIKHIRYESVLTLCPSLIFKTVGLFRSTFKERRRRISQRNKENLIKKSEFVGFSSLLTARKTSIARVNQLTH